MVVEPAARVAIPYYGSHLLPHHPYHPYLPHHPLAITQVADVKLVHLPSVAVEILAHFSSEVAMYGTLGIFMHLDKATDQIHAKVSGWLVGWLGSILSVCVCACVCVCIRQRRHNRWSP